jgi:hypothetical protein
MPKIINAFRGTDPTASVLAQLGQSLFGGNQTAAAIERERLRALQRINTETELLGQDTQAFGTPGYDPNTIAARAALAGDTGYADRHQFQTAVSSDQYDPISRAMLGAGSAMSSTPHGFGVTSAETARNNNMSSVDRRYSTDVGSRDTLAIAGDKLAEDMRQFGITFPETVRDNNMQSADRRYSTDVGSADSRYGVDQRIGEDARQFGITFPETVRDNNMQSADRRYGTDQGIGQQQYEFNRTPVPMLGPDGLPMFGMQGSLPAGAQPILSNTERQGTLAGQHFGQMGALPEQEQAYLGADPRAGTDRAPFNVIVDGKNYLTTDGVTDVHGNPVPPGGYKATAQGTATDVGLSNPVLADEQTKRLNYQRFGGLLDFAENLTTDPTLFGFTGTVRDVGQEVVQLMRNAGQVIGGTPEELLAKARQDSAASGVTLLPELYDPNLPAVDTIWGLMVYQGASALAGQQNRSVSDKDVQFFRQILGDPKAFFSSAEAMRAKIGVARQVMQGFQSVNNAALGAPGSQPPPASVQPPQGGVAPPPPQPQQMSPMSGQEPLIESPDQYNALPPGSVYWERDANGQVNLFRKP